MTEESPPTTQRWATIYRNLDPLKVEAVWLAIRSMEYPARLADRSGAIGDFDGPGDRPGEGSGERAGETAPKSGSDRSPTHVEVHEEHLSELHDVIDEIAREQEELDEVIERRAVSRQQRQRVITVVIAVGILLMMISMRLFG